MTERRRGPAAPARRLAAGLSTAATLGLIAGMAAAEAPTASAAAQSPAPFVTPTDRATATAPASAPKRVVIIRRHHLVQQAPVAPTRVVSRRALSGATTAQAPAPAPAPAPVEPQPVTSSGGS